MTVDGKGKDDSVELRRQAEMIAQRKNPSSKDLDGMSSEEIRQVFHELQVHQIELEMQNDELRRVQAELSINNERFFDLYDLAPVGYVTVGENGLILEANLTAATLLDVVRGMLIQRPFFQFILDEDRDLFYLHRTKLVQTGKPHSCQLRMMKKDGTIFWAHLESTVGLDEGRMTPVCRIMLSDISERKFREDMVELTTGLIAQIGTPEDLRQRMSSLTTTLKVWSGCEAVGIRLKDGDDFPYYETLGFPPAFVEAESHLCARRSNGEIMRDSTGNPVLECMCGNILCSRFDPAKPFFTANGSFWSNSTTALLASTTEADRHARTRNRCNGEGYESVALIPLRIESQILGLLQFNDHRPKRFSPVLIGHLEKIADVLSIALLRRQTEERLRESEFFFKESQHAANIGSYKADFIEGFWKSSEVLDQIFGIDSSYTKSIQGWLDIIAPDDREGMSEYLTKEVIEKHRQFDKEYRIVRKSDGEVRWVNGRGTLSLDADGNTVSMIGTIQDITERKHAEKAIITSNKLLHAIINTAPMRIFYKNKELRYLGSNVTFAKDAGVCCPEDLIGKDDYQLAWREQADLYRNDDLRILESGDSKLCYDEKQTTSEGNQIWIRSSKVPLRDESNTITGILGMYEDITERKHAEEALRESERRYLTLFANQMNGIAHCRVITDEDGRPIDYWILRINEAYERIIGVKKADIEGHRVREVFPGVENFSFDYIGILGKIALDGGEINTEVFFETTRQNFILYAYSPLPGEFTAILTDITERKKIEEDIRVSEERLSSAAKAANFGVYSYNFSSGYAYYSPEFLSFYGLPPGSPLELDEDLTPKSLHPDDKPGFLAKMKAANAPCGSGILEHVYRIIHPDGQIRWLRVNGQTTFSGRHPNGRPLYATGVIQDITEGKRLGEEQKQWEKKRQQLQRAESLRTMAGAIAHHFNNQLAGVIGNLEIAIDDIPRDTKHAQILNASMEAALNAVETSSLMLTYLGQTTGKRVPVDLSDVCRHALPLLQAAIPKHLIFKSDLPTPGPIVSANTTQIQQTLTNLVTNAWEAAGKNPAVIDLTVKTVSPANIPATQRFPIDWQPQDMTYTCIEVQDTSGGITGEDIEKLFDPFFSSKFPGRGLGLSVALGIVNAHDGSIAVESKVGSGSTFRVYIPISAETVPSQPDKAVLSPAGERISTVLLVEDQEIVRDMTHTMLTRLGLKVLVAKDGVEAVEIFQQHLDEIEIVLTDLSIPRMDGWETLSALRRIRPDIPVILATGQDDSLVNTDDRSELPQVFLHKPYQKATLKDALVKAMGSILVNHSPVGNTTPSAGDVQ